MAEPSLDDIKAPQVESGNPDFLAEEERRIYTKNRQEAELESLKTDTAARKTYANRIYWLAIVWLSAVLAILLLQGFHLFSWNPLPDNVMIALVAGSTTGVLGILASVIAYIFRAPSNH